MTHRQPCLTLYTIIFGFFFISLAFNIHYYFKLQALENASNFWRCGTNEYEFSKIQDEIKRLENNPFLRVGEPKSVLKK